MNNLRSALTVVLLTPFPALACSLDFALKPTPISVNYEPFSSLGALGKTTFELKNTGAEDEFILELRKLEGSQLDDFSLSFEAKTSDAQLRTIDENRFRLSIDSGQAKQINLNTLVSHASVPAAGVTTATYELEATSATTGLSCWEEEYLSVQINAPSRAQLNIAGTDSAFVDGPDIYHLDFGRLVEGLSRRIFLQLRANEDVLMTLESENKGTMRHKELVKYAVAYQFALSGQVLDLSSKTSLSLPAAPTFRGVSLPVDITIGEVDGVPSGDYADTITIDVSAL
ncbi:hypothetical protein [Gilvimarinus sp. DA14]|uniref:hypothetical protein n=1 Tax=Gilvimarinus sp. DA14 TaxID=2956798 RepID=UPI0020B727C0|nr:hypothetical protein [Gilvimarinus sp. DA14]UTF60851.1 hypothetical protein NHM04_03345 [Gilvimarinus sp. DA14]